MIKRTVRKLLHKSKIKKDVIRYDMFDMERTRREVKSAHKLERIYHKGQDQVWDGKKVLKALLKKHDGIQITPDKMGPLSRIFAVIFWGEMAAWKVSTELATDLVSLESKMAATSQAHDEARHFYVLHDYLELLGYTPEQLPNAAAAILDTILSADTLAKKLMGMQLMVEPIALTLFQVVREAEIEPVLCDLLSYYERDEARHVALGVQHLPVLLSKMTLVEKLELLLWEMKLFSLEIDALVEMQPDIEALGFHPREVIRIGQIKQFHAARLLQEQTTSSLPVEELVARMVEFRMVLAFPSDDDAKSTLRKWKRALRALIFSAEQSRDISRELDEMSSEDVFNTKVASFA